MRSKAVREVADRETIALPEVMENASLRPDSEAAALPPLPHRSARAPGPASSRRIHVVAVDGPDLDLRHST